MRSRQVPLSVFIIALATAALFGGLLLAALVSFAQTPFWCGEGINDAPCSREWISALGGWVAGLVALPSLFILLRQNDTASAHLSLERISALRAEMEGLKEEYRMVTAMLNDIDQSLLGSARRGGTFEETISQELNYIGSAALELIKARRDLEFMAAVNLQPDLDTERKTAISEIESAIKMLRKHSQSIRRLKRLNHPTAVGLDVFDQLAAITETVDAIIDPLRTGGPIARLRDELRRCMQEDRIRIQLEFVNHRTSPSAHR